MRVNDDLHIIPVTFVGQLGSMLLNLSLISDPAGGLILVDTSMPGHIETVAAALAADGFSIKNLSHIVLTHQDIDHIGSLADIKAASGAEAVAHSVEAPYIEGKKKLAKYPSQERLDQNPGIKEMFDKIGFAPVDRLVEDGDVLDVAGGVRIIYTPGHAPGHISLYLERSKALITGDALVSDNGRLGPPGLGATPDYPTAIKSVQKLAALPEVSAIVAYHGGLVTDDPRGQLQRVADELTSEAAK